ncbi:MAG TPA: hypothetical protein PKY81_16810 [bacterium]|nr:hypothetical protein [bacterium]
MSDRINFPDQNNNYHAFRSLIDEHIENHNYTEAYELLTSIKDKTSCDEEYFFILAYTQVQLGLSDDAIRTLLELTNLNVNIETEGVIRGFLAEILHDNGMIFKAFEEIEIALKCDPKDEKIKIIYNKIAQEFGNRFGDFLLLIRSIKSKKIYKNSMN